MTAQWAVVSSYSKKALGLNSPAGALLLLNSPLLKLFNWKLWFQFE